MDVVWDEMDEHEYALMIRPEAWVAYWFTAVILASLGWYCLTLCYLIYAISLVTIDEEDEEDQDMENIWLEITAKHRDLHAVDVRLGYVWAVLELPDLLDSVVDDPILPLHYLEINNFLLNVTKYPIHQKYEYLYFPGLPTWESPIKPLMQNALPRSEVFKRTYAEYGAQGIKKELKLVKYRLLSLIIEDHLVSAHIATGIFSENEYDFEDFIYNENIIFAEYELAVSLSRFKTNNIQILNEFSLYYKEDESRCPYWFYEDLADDAESCNKRKLQKKIIDLLESFKEEDPAMIDYWLIYEREWSATKRRSGPYRHPNDYQVGDDDEPDFF
jgi:hypothetical protein